MRIFLILLLAMVFMLVGCRPASNMIRQAGSMSAEEQRDSTVYEVAKAAMLSDNFVFRISTIIRGGQLIYVNSQDNYIRICNDIGTYQRNSATIGRGPTSYTMKVKSLSKQYDSKSRTLTVKGSLKNILSAFEITLFEGSNKAKGSAYDNLMYQIEVEGVIEPGWDTNIVRGEPDLKYE